MKILLISPPAEKFLGFPPKPPYVPLGLGYLGSVLKKNGHEVTIRDMYLYRYSKVKAEIEKVGADIVGISCSTLGRNQAIKTAKIAKESNPGLKVLMGGPHATFCPEVMFQLAPIDAIVMGEGEETVVDLVAALERNSDLSEVRGIAFKKGEVIKTSPRPLIKDLDGLPLPMYDYFNLKNYKSVHFGEERKNLIGTYILTSRGCPFGCQFCSSSRFWGRVWRARSPMKVVDELEWLHKEYNVSCIYFIDDIFTLDKGRVIEICKEILNRKLDLMWMTETRVDCVNKEMLTWMKKAGCFKVVYGVESGSEEILKTINKGFTTEQVREAFKVTQEVGLQAQPLLMVGNPGESEQTIDDTIELMKEIKAVDCGGVGLTCIFPNTPLHELAKSKGIVSDDYWLTSKSPPYYTGDHTFEALMRLNLRLVKGVVTRRYLLKRGFIRGIITLFTNPKVILSYFSIYLRYPRKFANLFKKTH